MLFSKLRGGTVTALDTRKDRLDFCKAQLGMAAVVQIGPDDEQQLAALTDNEYFDVVFDATGNSKAMERGFKFVAHAGTYVLISVVGATITFSDPEFHKRETTLMGSRNATAEDFEIVLEAMRAGQIPTAALNTHRMALADVPADFKTLLDPAMGVVKAIVEC
jgi:threonine dehydrogenase-like Zn-dependent dehydrogenase